MLRLTCTQRPERRIVVEGNLVGPYVEELRSVSAPFRSRREPWILDLAGVAFADGGGVALLAELESAGAELTGGSAFLMELLRRRTAGDERDSSAKVARGWDREQALVQALRSGGHAGKDAEEAIVRQFGPDLLTLAERFLGSREEASRALCEAWPEAVDALRKGRDVVRLGPWLRRLVARTALRLRGPVASPSASKPTACLPQFTREGQRLIDLADEQATKEG
jgi:ABC-type transporter Mla MlaB component